ncbi:GMP synthase (glutamine-hydrolyzing) [Ancylobacter sp. 3268]|uniref:glutamine amidotransferase n=1 Tax=Ancylobacter sp. 3268 TaxID=2817752 RepID=UPI002858DB89|nr:glutamine amidotransferase [Ancylobacter sp. 3268]MDR6952348.1 GMP synthase (glutamine-hydrolyzing) [Ancylobacter sp. 3268]
MGQQPSSDILIVLHQEHSSPGRVGRLLVERGHRLDVRRPCLGDPLPATLAGHAGAVIFGGPQSANDCHDYVRAEIDWIGVALKEAKPYLGICLGAQMLARHLGARVAPHPEGLVEIGYYPLRPTAVGRALLGEAQGEPAGRETAGRETSGRGMGAAADDWPNHVYHWHREGFELARGAELLASGDAFPNQAFRYGPAAYGLQFHPEVTHHMMCRWTVHGSERLSLPGARPRSAHFSDRLQHDGRVRLWLESFLDRWLGGPADADAFTAPLRAAAQ